MSVTFLLYELSIPRIKQYFDFWSVAKHRQVGPVQSPWPSYHCLPSGLGHAQLLCPCRLQPGLASPILCAHLYCRRSSPLPGAPIAI